MVPWTSHYNKLGRSHLGNRCLPPCFFTVILVLPSFLEQKQRNILTCLVQTAKHFWSSDTVGKRKLWSPFVGYAENNEAGLPSDADGRSNLSYAPPRITSRRVLHRNQKIKTVEKKITSSSLMTTHDPSLLPPHIPPGRGRVVQGVPEVFLSTPYCFCCSRQYYYLQLQASAHTTCK